MNIIMVLWKFDGGGGGDEDKDDSSIAHDQFTIDPKIIWILSY